MRYLIDTNIFIWWMEKNKRISKDLMVLLNDPAISIFLSVGSIWEMVIKRAKGKLKLSQDIEKGIQTSRFEILSIQTSHALAVGNLPDYHKDPFDRILIAQTKSENLTLITSDPKIWKYKIDLLKA